MSQGSLVCCGSPLFLKSNYGYGYNLILTRKITRQNVIQRTEDKDIAELIKSIVPSAQINSSINTEISFKLPTEESSKFPKLLTQIEDKKDKLNVSNIGISVTSLEEVFLKLFEFLKFFELKLNFNFIFQS